MAAGRAAGCDPALSAGDLLNALADAAEAANRAISGLTSDPDADHVTGTTLTAMVVAGSHLALYLLCSDGVSAVIPDNDIRRVLCMAADPENAVSELTALVHGAGAPDNVSCVVADIDPVPA
jgi:serine/threonine protein phosphatase PrpC